MREVAAGVAVAATLALFAVTGTGALAQEQPAGGLGADAVATAAQAGDGGVSSSVAASAVDASAAGEAGAGATPTQADAPATGAGAQGVQAQDAASAPGVSTGVSASSDDQATAGDGAGAEQAHATSTQADDAAPLMALAAAAALRSPAPGGSGAQVDVDVTELKIQTLSHEDVTEMFISNTFSLKLRWDASRMGNDLHAGDYFDVTIPDEMRFVSDAPESDFDLTDDDGNVVATAHVTTGADGAGGTIHVTFTDYVEGKYNVKGTMYLGAQFNRTKVTEGDGQTFAFSVNGQVTPGPTTDPVTVVGPQDLTDEYLCKWGEKVADNPNEVKWVARVNWAQAHMDDLVISDELSSDDSLAGIAYDPTSFTLTRVTFDSKGNVTAELGTIDLTDRLQVSADGTSFTLDLGDVARDGSQFMLRYRSSYRPGMLLKNHLQMNANGVSKETWGSYQSAESGGSGGGDLANKIRIVKVDAADGQTPLAGATFLVTGADGASFELTTGADGTATSGYLTQGTYTVVETVAPTGYVLDDQPHTLEVTAAGGAVLTVSDVRQTVSVPVSKIWDDGDDQDGLRPGSVSVRLLANGEPTGQTLTLSADNGWSGAFDDLAQYDEAGAEIAYAVDEEDVPAGYEATVSGDAQDGYVVTNAHAPQTVDVPVTKTWVGPAADGVTVRLLADGVDTGESLTLTADAGWAGAFTGLPAHRDHGAVIAYTVREDPIAGYDSAVAGDARDGFAITNTATATTEITGTKTWDDADDQDGMRPASITVDLLADGTKVASRTVDAAQGWAYAFTDLPVYDHADGHRIAYAVSEQPVAGYEAMVVGTDLVNTHVPQTVDVPVAKTWVGTTGGPVTIHLLADGVDTGKTLTLSADNGWKGSFTGLPACRDHGTAIAYTVREDTVSGYATTVTGDAKTGFTVTNAATEVPPTPPTETPKTPTPSTPSNPPAPSAPAQGSTVPKTGDQTDLLGVNLLVLAGGCAVVAGIAGIVIALHRRSSRQ